MFALLLSIVYCNHNGDCTAYARSTGNCTEKLIGCIIASANIVAI